MKKLLISTIAAVSLSTSAFAGDVTLTVPDTFKITMQNTSVALERCMGAIVAKGDTSICQSVQNILVQLANLPETPVAQPAAAPAPAVVPPSAPPAAAAPTPTPPPAAEAQKKTEGDAGK
jgi:hypothetical protein